MKKLDFGLKHYPDKAYSSNSYDDLYIAFPEDIAGLTRNELDKAFLRYYFVEPQDDPITKFVLGVFGLLSNDTVDQLKLPLNAHITLDQSVKYLQEASAAGVVEANYVLGKFHLRYVDVYFDDIFHRQYLWKDIYAPFTFTNSKNPQGDLIKMGLGWLEKAANVGHTRAQLCLARYYMYKDYDLAQKYLDMTKDNDDAIGERAYIEGVHFNVKHFNTKDDDKALLKAVECFKIAVEHNYLNAYNVLASRYTIGEGGAEKDLHKAVKILESKYKNNPQVCNIGYDFREVFGKQIDYEEIKDAIKDTIFCVVEKEQNNGVYDIAVSGQYKIEGIEKTLPKLGIGEIPDYMNKLTDYNWGMRGWEWEFEGIAEEEYKYRESKKLPPQKVTLASKLIKTDTRYSKFQAEIVPQFDVEKLQLAQAKQLQHEEKSRNQKKVTAEVKQLQRENDIKETKTRVIYDYMAMGLVTVLCLIMIFFRPELPMILFCAGFVLLGIGLLFLDIYFAKRKLKRLVAEKEDLFTECLTILDSTAIVSAKTECLISSEDGQNLIIALDEPKIVKISDIEDVDFLQTSTVDCRNVGVLVIKTHDEVINIINVFGGDKAYKVIQFILRSKQK